MKIALVTGANRGIGFEVARQLAKKGLQVILTSRDPKKGEKAFETLKAEDLPVSYYPLDVANVKSIEQVAKHVQDRFGRLDVLINNAGIMIDHTSEPSEENTASIFHADIDTIRKTMETNVYGPIQLIQKFIPLMLKNKYGRIVNISSGMGQLTEMNGGWPGYRISKTSLNAVTRIVADETKDTNVLVNSVCPGWVKTDMGGPNAEITTTEAADTIVWLATLPEGGPSGGFYRERKTIEW
jgi:NAD(P)-dependent dehydrogenase (short-subunit alcohol dehydrogenase family)